MGQGSGKPILEGNLGDVTLADVVQMVASSRNPREIDVRVGARLVGHVTLVQGRVSACSAFGLTGAEAFFHLVQQRSGRYSVRSAEGTASRWVDPTLENLSLHDLLVESVRRLDTTSGVRPAVPTPLGDADLAFEEPAAVPSTARSGSGARPNAYVAELLSRADDAHAREDLREALRLYECALAIAPEDSSTRANVVLVRAKLQA
jgi:hypothetical protein